IATLLVLLTAVAAASVRVLAQAPERGGGDEVATAPVEIDGVELFRLRGTSSYPAEVRAAAVRDRVIAAANDPSVTPDSLRLVENNGLLSIAAGDRPIVTIVDADAALEQVGRTELANAHLIQLRQAIVNYRAARTPAALERAALTTLV